MLFWDSFHLANNAHFDEQEEEEVHQEKLLDDKRGILEEVHQEKLLDDKRGILVDKQGMIQHIGVNHPEWWPYF
jgi:hypothetical protein